MPVEPKEELGIGQLLQAVVQAGITDANVGVLERIVAMKERAEAKQAEREFAIAFHALQSEMPKIQAMDEVPDKQGNVRYVFASYQAIMEEVGPLLLKHGFTVSFDSEHKEQRLVMRCTLTHVGGHSRVTTQMMRYSSPYGANDTQGDGATATMARRYALCSCLNIVIDRDTDGATNMANEGQPITFEQAQTLKEMVKEARADEARFLTYAGATSFGKIGSNRYKTLFAELQARIDGGGK